MIMRKLFHNITSRQGKFNQICARYGSSEKAVATNTQNKVILQTVTTTEELENGIIDWNTELKKIKQDENRSVLLPPTQEDDLQSFTPYLKQSFNFAAYVNKSKTLQELVKLGVDLSKLEKMKNVPDYILQLDYDKDIKNRIIYLNGLGVPMEELGKFLTKNPGFLKEDIDDVQTRIYYMQYKQFTPEMISRIITKNPMWLSYSTRDIDQRLGYFQKDFNLTGNEVRALANAQPRLITYSMNSIKENTFTIKEEMGFTDDEMKILLLRKPRIWMQNRFKLLAKFDYIHNTMKISHKHILEMPEIFYAREFIIKQRDSFLRHLNRNQYDCTKPNYVSLKALIEGTNEEFCINVAGTPVETFNLYLKSL